MPRAKKTEGKPAGRTTAYAYFVKTCRTDHAARFPGEKVAFSDFSKNCSLRWKAMSESDKTPYKIMAENDKNRYDKEMKKYVPPVADQASERKSRGAGKSKKTKDPNAPKRSLSAFFWFCNDERPKIKSLNPEFSVGEIAKVLGKEWTNLDPQLKKRYELMAERDKNRYQREMEAYKNAIAYKNAMLQEQLDLEQRTFVDEDDDDIDLDEEDEDD